MSEQRRDQGATRRSFLEGLIALAPATWLYSLSSGCGQPAAPSAAAPPGVDTSITFTAKQLALLHAVCDRLLPTDQDPGSKEAGVPDFIVNELRTRYYASSRDRALRGLDALDQLAQRELGKSFTGASTEEMDKLLRAWQIGEVKIDKFDGRDIVEFYLMLSLEGFLAPPIYGGNRDEVGWKMIGFHRCGPQPKLAKLHPDPLEHSSRRSVSHQRDECDAVIVGSGAGAGPVAQILSQAGMRVVVLEKGPWYTKRDFLHDEIMMARRDFFVPAPDVDPHILVEGFNPPAFDTNSWTSRCVGGGTVHMSGFFLRMRPEDFRLRTLIGELEGTTLADWPIAYEELAPYYDWVEREIGVSGKIGPGQVGSPFPLPPLRAHPWSSYLDQGANKVGAITFPTPRAVLSRTYDGRPPCNYCGFCGSYGCENDSKSSSLSAFLPHALASGNCEIRPYCQAREVVTDSSGRARTVRYLDADGKDHGIHAKVVVLACSAIETARLLLLSTAGKFTKGLANSTGLVGRNLVLSTFGGGEAWLNRDGASAEMLRVLDSELPFLQRTTQSYYWNPDAGLPHPKGGSMVYLWPHPNPIHTAASLANASTFAAFGSRLKDRLRSAYRQRHKVKFETFAEFLTNPGTRVSLDPKAKDRLGLAAARLHVNPHPANRENALYLVNRGIEILEAAGATEPRGVDIGNTTMILQGGTCRFGHDSDQAVLDVDCQAFDVPNLFVTDGSFMPTSGGVPFTLTIMANAARVANRILARSRRGELG